MTPDEKTRAYRRDMAVAVLMGVTGLGVSAAALVQLRTANGTQLAQATPPLQSTPGAESKPGAPDSQGTTGSRPQATPPQPAQPDADARKSGATQALPQAPAEKLAPPITTK